MPREPLNNTRDLPCEPSTNRRGLPRAQSAEHEFEAEHGLPEALPRDERLLWQGSPDWRVMAREALHTRAIGIYFGVLLAWRGATVLGDDGSVLDAAEAILRLLPLALAAIAVLSSLAWLIARTTVYTITDKRVVMRIGVVLSITFNLPYSQIESASLRMNSHAGSRPHSWLPWRSHQTSDPHSKTAAADGSGDLALVLADTDRIAYFHLWPHVRPWQVKRTQPMLRALPQARVVAAILSAALAESAGLARSALPTVDVPERGTHLPTSATVGQQPLAA